MPLYEYRCSACGRATEAIQSVHDDPLTVCESCGGELKKQISSPAFQFKGSGWYVSDYGRGNSSPGEKPKGEPGEGGKTEGPGPDAKPTDKPADKPSDRPSTGGGEGSSSKDGGKSSG